MVGLIVVTAVVVVRLLQSGDAVVELMLWPAAVVLAVVGVTRMRQVPHSSSWTWVAAAVLAGCVPSLMLASVAGPDWRIVAVGVIAAVALVAGVVLQWQSPVVIGASVLVLHLLIQLAPWIVLVASGMPRVISLGVLGIGFRSGCSASCCW